MGRNILESTKLKSRFLSGPRSFSNLKIDFVRFFILVINRFKYHGRSNLPATINTKRPITVNSNCEFDFLAICRSFNLQISGICHVGAHKGEEIASYLSAGVDNLLLIEPLEENYNVLLDLVASLPNAVALNVAAGEIAGTAEMFISTNDLQSSSLLKPALHLRDAPEVQFLDKRSVNVVTVDSVMPVDHSYNYWVVDVQGYELMALRGARESLRNCEFLFIEVNRDETYENCTKVDELDRFLRNVGLHRVLTRWWGIWGDALYVRE